MATQPGKGAREPKRLPLLGQAPAREAVPCLTCGLCCTYIAVAIDGPNSVREATEILWHLYHDHVSVYRDSEDEWMVQFETRCRHLLTDNRCAIYETRPQICRTYSEESCEVNADDEGMSFYSPEAFLTYLETRSRRIYGLVKRRFMPGPEHLAPRKLGKLQNPPSFEKRFLALRSR
jgi:Fe-S-cluster containining protein